MHDTVNEQSGAEAALTACETPAIAVADTVARVLRATLSFARVHCEIDYESLTRTPETAADPQFVQSVASIAAAIAATVHAEPATQPSECDIDLWFSGVPASGSLQCALELRRAAFDVGPLAETVGAHGGALLPGTTRSRATIGLYPDAL